MPLGVEVGLGPGDYVLDGDPAPASLKTGGSTPDQFSAYVDCGQTAGWIKTALGTEVGLGPGHIVLGGDPAPLPKKGDRAPQFSARLYCGQTAGCIKMPLGMEVGLSPGEFVLDGEPAPSPKRGQSPSISGSWLLWQNGLMYQDATWYGGGRPQPKRHCITWGPCFPLPKGHSPPIFGPRLLWPNGCMYQDTTWYGGRPQPR